MSRNPWDNSGYVLPQNVKDEPLGQGTLATKWAKRGTISDHVPKNTFIIPKKPLTTKWAKRGTISDYTPNYLGTLGNCEPENLGSLSGTSLKKSVLSGNSLDKDSLLGSSRDPIASFGKEGSALILDKVKGVPKSQRVLTLKAVLASIKPGLDSTFSTKIIESRKKHNISSKAAIGKALSATLANHYVDQLKILKRTGSIPRQGIMGLGAYEESLACACDNLKTNLAVGGLFGSITSSVGKLVGGGAKAVSSGAKKAGSAIKSGAKAAYNAGKSAIKGLASLACKAANADGASMAAAAAGAPGADKIAASLCSGPQPSMIETPMFSTGGSSLPLVPILIGGGVLAFLLLRKK